MISTRALVDLNVTGGEIRINYDNALWFVIAIKIQLGIVSVSLFPIHDNANWAGVSQRFDIPTCDVDLPMWNVVS